MLKFLRKNNIFRVELNDMGLLNSCVFLIKLFILLHYFNQKEHFAL